jgi:hypothetical protein
MLLLLLLLLEQKGTTGLEDALRPLSSRFSFVCFRLGGYMTEELEGEQSTCIMASLSRGDENERERE